MLKPCICFILEDGVLLLIFCKGRGLSNVSRSRGSAVAEVGQEARVSGLDTSQELCPSPRGKGGWRPSRAPLPRGSGATEACGRAQGTV